MKRLREWFSGLADRERRLVALLMGAMGLFFVFIIPYLVSMTLSSRRDEIKELRGAISFVQSSRDRVAQRSTKRGALAARYGSPAPPLAGFLETAAHEAGLAIPESQDLSEVNHGKRFKERSTVVRLRKVGMLALVRLLEKIESSGYPVVISRLHIRRRGGETDSYDVELNVSAFDSTTASASGPHAESPKALESARSSPPPRTAASAGER
jgi:general secretion pathway protein M